MVPSALSTRQSALSTNPIQLRTTPPDLFYYGLTHDVGRLVYERMAAEPDRLYGAGIGSSYGTQGLALSKHFFRD